MQKEIFRGCPGVPVHEGIPIVFITIHGLMTQFVNVSFFCVPVHEDTTNISNDHGFVQLKMRSWMLYGSSLVDQIVSKSLRKFQITKTVYQTD